MGVDVELYVEADISDEELIEKDRYYKSITNFGDYAEARYGLFKLIRQNLPWYGCGPTVEVYSLDRYWGPSGGKGHWPQILDGIRALQMTFPNSPIHYHDDTWDGPSDPLTEDDITEMTLYWNATSDPKERL
jgi:hypothetical protein